MGRYKITTKLLEDVAYYAEDEYPLEELFDELNISKRLLKDEDILHAYDFGRGKLFIQKLASHTPIEDVMEDMDMSEELCWKWRDKYSNLIQEARTEIQNEKKHATKQFSDPLYSGVINILEQNPSKATGISHEVLKEDIKKIVESAKNGDTTELLTMLTTNILQLQLFNGTITNNIMGDPGKQLPNFERLANMQIKVMQETRKSIMAINEITNPKRTTFIKEANQHNHLHQNSQEKVENKNELQKQLVEPIESPSVPIFQEVAKHEKK